MVSNPAKGSDITIKANGITICYDDAGTGNVPIIFIHGFPFNKSTWQGQLESLSATHRVICYDIRGFGKSEKGNEKLTIGLFADDLIRFMDALEIKKSVICGLSMGGYIVLNAINRYPERFEAVILCDTQCIADSLEAKEKRMKSIKKIEEGGLTEFSESFTKVIFCNQSVASKGNAIKAIQNIIISTPTETIIDTLKALAQRWEMCSTVKEISVPALIICGKEDAVTPLPQSELLHTSISNSELHIIENAGHMSNVEQPKQFNMLLKKFLFKVFKNDSMPVDSSGNL